MAENYPLESQIAAGMQRQLVSAEAQIAAWHTRWEQIFEHGQGHIRAAQLSTLLLQSQGVAPADIAQEAHAALTDALQVIREAREEREAEPPPLASLEDVTVWRYGREAVDEARSLGEDLAERYVAPNQDEPPWLLLDTMEQDTGQALDRTQGRLWQECWAQIEARLEALEHATDERQHQQEQDMGY